MIAWLIIRYFKISHFSKYDYLFIFYLDKINGKCNAIYYLLLKSFLIKNNYIWLVYY